MGVRVVRDGEEDGGLTRSEFFSMRELTNEEEKIPKEIMIVINLQNHLKY